MKLEHILICNVLGLVFFNNYNDCVKLDSLIMLRVGVTCQCHMFVYVVLLVLLVLVVLLVTPFPKMCVTVIVLCHVSQCSFVCVFI